MHKRIIVAIIALAAAFALAACGDSNNKSVKLADEAQVEAADKTAENAAAPKADDTDKETKKDDAEKAEDKDKETTDEDAEKEAEPETEELETVEGVVAPKERLQKEWIGKVAADGDGLNLRSGPDSKYEEIDVIPDDTEVTIIAEENGWGYTTYRDQYGWVSLDWIQK